MVANWSFVQSEIGTMRLAYKTMALACAVLFALALLIWLERDTRDPIASPMLTEALNSPVRAGDNLRVRITRDKVRDDCPVVSVRTFVDENGRKYSAPTAITAGGDADERYAIFDYPVPETLPPGGYELRVSLTYICPSVEPFLHTQEPVRFVVSE